MAKKTDKQQEGIVKVEEALSKTEHFIEQNQNLLLISIGAIVLVILIFFGFKRLYLQPREEEAQKQMFMAEKYFGADSLDLALNGDGMYPGFLQIIDDYSMTKSANLSHYYAGIIYLKKGDLNNAIDYLKDFKGRDQIVNAMAKGAIGDAYMELNNPGDALDYYLAAAEVNDNEFTAPMFYQKAGWACEKLGKFSQALEIYEKIKTDFPKSNEAREIDKYIARAKGMTGR